MNTKLKMQREKVGLTQAQVAQKANMSVTNYQRIERGAQDPRASAAILIAKAVKSTVEKLF